MLRKLRRSMNDKVSIIVPVYNVPDFLLKKCIKSLLKQTYRNKEVIVVNDGTSQSNLKTILKFKNNKDIVILNKQNGGLSSARNYGVAHSTGDWICFVDGDDRLKTDTLTKVMKEVQKYDEIICFGTIKEYQNRKFNYDFNNIFRDKVLYADNLQLIKYLFDFKTQLGDATAKLYKKEFLYRYQIEHDTAVRQGIESIIFNYFCFLHTLQLHYVDYYGYIYTYNQKSITLYQDDMCVQNIVLGIRKLNELIKQNKFYDDILPVFLERVQYIIVTTLISGYLSPVNLESKKEKYKKIDQFLSIPEVKESLYSSMNNLNVLRRIVLYLAKKRRYFMISVIAKIRNIQKEKF